MLQEKQNKKSGLLLAGLLVLSLTTGNLLAMNGGNNQQPPQQNQQQTEFKIGKPVSHVAIAALGILGLSYFIMQLRKPNKEGSHLPAQWDKVTNFSKSTGVGEWFANVGKLCWYAVWDGVIGQKSKSESVKVDKETGNFVISGEKIESFGVLGHYVEDNIKSFKTTLETIGLAYFGYYLIRYPHSMFSKVVHEKSQKI